MKPIRTVAAGLGLLLLGATSAAFGADRVVPTDYSTLAEALVHECARPCDPSLESCHDVGARGPAAQALKLKTGVAGHSRTNAMRTCTLTEGHPR